ncbi:MAG: hypothetical protein H6828_01980 [Planctomycetes bacterium]|nr:hypothetical protein [Planctomycetota bacterium]
MAQTAVITTCPECGAKIPKAGMSICPYCVAPLKASPGKSIDREPLVQRLVTMPEKPDYAAACATAPPWSPEYQRAKNRQMQGSLLVVVGLVFVALQYLLSDAGWGFWTGLGGVLLLVGLWMALRGMLERSKLDRLELQKRPVYVIERSSVTDFDGKGTVRYFFDLQFADGTDGIYFYTGRGVSEELYANGMTGVAWTRGRELLGINRVRV